MLSSNILNKVRLFSVCECLYVCACMRVCVYIIIDCTVAKVMILLMCQ